MTKYNVLVTADTTVSTEIVVEANSPEEAEETALAAAHDEPWKHDWERDEGVCSDPYIADPGNAATPHPHVP